jgi:hypothetical protein
MSETILGYYVYDGYKWLHEDEHTWTDDFFSSAEFTDAKLAQEIGEREAGDLHTIYVMACLGWQ